MSNQFSQGLGAIRGLLLISVHRARARLRMHRNNISRYRRLLKTDLSELERQFIERRTNAERSALESAPASSFPLNLKIREPMFSPAAKPPKLFAWLVEPGLKAKGK